MNDIDEVPVSGAPSNDSPIDEKPISSGGPPMTMGNLYKIYNAASAPGGPLESPEAKAARYTKQAAGYGAEALGRLGVNPNVAASATILPAMLPDIVKGYAAYEPAVGLVQGGVNLATKGANWLKGLANAGDAADALRPTTSELESGLKVQGSKDKMEKLFTYVKNAIYQKTKGVMFPTQGINSGAKEVLNDLKGEPLPMGEVQDLAQRMATWGGKAGEADYEDVDQLRAAAGRLAYKGKGKEQIYGARLKALVDDNVNKFSGAPEIPLSQQGDQAAADLREKWVNVAKEQGTGLNPKQTANYARLANDTPQSSSPAYQLYQKQQQLAQNVKDAHAFNAEMSDTFNHPVANAIEKAAPEKVHDAIFSGGQISRVQAAQKVLEPSAFADSQSHFYKDILDSPNIQRTMAQFERKAPGYLKQVLRPQQYTALVNRGSQQFFVNAATSNTAKAVGGGLVGTAVGYGIKKGMGQ